MSDASPLARDTLGDRGLRPIDQRSRRRARNAAEVERTALHLFAERGYGNVTVGDVAGAADISTRTFYRYFPNKEDVVLAGIVDRLAGVPLVYWQRPVDEPVVLALRHALSKVADGASFAGDPMERDRATVLAAEPEMAKRGLDRLHDLHDRLTEHTAFRMGVDPRSDPRPGVIVAAMAGGLRAGWLAAVSSGRVDQVPGLTAEALDVLVPVLTTLAEPR